MCDQGRTKEWHKIKGMALQARRRARERHLLSAAPAGAALQNLGRKSGKKNYLYTNDTTVYIGNPKGYFKRSL